MILHYTFTVEEEVMVQRYYSCEDIEPDYTTKEVEQDYDYSVEPDADDYWEFLRNRIPNTGEWTKDQWQSAEETFKIFYNEEMIISLDYLDEDDDFIDFMKEKYEDRARDECEEEYGA